MLWSTNQKLLFKFIGEKLHRITSIHRNKYEFLNVGSNKMSIAPTSLESLSCIQRAPSDGDSFSLPMLYNVIKTVSKEDYCYFLAALP